MLLTNLPPSDGITDTWHGIHINARYWNLAYPVPSSPSPQSTAG